MDKNYDLIIETYGQEEFEAAYWYVKECLKHPQLQPSYYTEDFQPDAWVVTLLAGLANSARQEIDELKQQISLLVEASQATRQ